MTHNHLKRLLWGVSLLVAVYYVSLFLFQLAGGNPRALNPWSKLGLYEESIEAVSSEFMRRSPSLSASFEDFKRCMASPICEDSERLRLIMKHRDETIRKEWPLVFDRLVNDGGQDWLKPSSDPSKRELKARDAHDRFFRSIRHLGADRLRNHCVPIIEFYTDPQSHMPYYRLNREQGYRCN